LRPSARRRREKEGKHGKNSGPTLLMNRTPYKQPDQKVPERVGFPGRRITLVSMGCLKDQPVPEKLHDYAFVKRSCTMVDQFHTWCCIEERCVSGPLAFSGVGSARSATLLLGPALLARPVCSRSSVTSFKDGLQLPLSKAVPRTDLDIGANTVHSLHNCSGTAGWFFRPVPGVREVAGRASRAPGHRGYLSSLGERG